MGGKKINDGGNYRHTDSLNYLDLMFRAAVFYFSLYGYLASSLNCNNALASPPFIIKEDFFISFYVQHPGHRLLQR